MYFCWTLNSWPSWPCSIFSHLHEALSDLNPIIAVSIGAVKCSHSGGESESFPADPSFFGCLNNLAEIFLRNLSDPINRVSIGAVKCSQWRREWKLGGGKSGRPIPLFFAVWEICLKSFWEICLTGASWFRSSQWKAAPVVASGGEWKLSRGKSGRIPVWENLLNHYPSGLDFLI